MARQARSEATRQRIIDAALDLFDEVGYSAIGLGDIIERAQLTKGALYHHFDSKESLATAIMEDGDAVTVNTFDRICEVSAPALENMVRCTFMVADLVTSDKFVRVSGQLARTLGEFNGEAARTYSQWAAMLAALVRQAGVEGDVRASLDPDATGELIVEAMLGAVVMSGALSRSADLRARFVRAWETLLPGIVTEESLPYFREYLARESLRDLPPALPIE